MSVLHPRSVFALEESNYNSQAYLIYLALRYEKDYSARNQVTTTFSMHKTYLSILKKRSCCN